MPQLTFTSVSMWGAQDGGGLLLGGAGITGVIGVIGIPDNVAMARVFVTAFGITAIMIFGATGILAIGFLGVTS